MADVFQYRECRATITARTPDTPDADAHPDRVLVQGRGTAHPQFQGGSVVFTEIGEYAIPQPIPVVIVDGELLVEVLSGDESVETQPLFLPVTVDERANQNWSWRLTFDFLTLGEHGEEVSHPPLSFPVEAGDGPLELSTVATPTVRSSGFITRGQTGTSIDSIAASNGDLIIHLDDGTTSKVPIPDAVQGPPGTISGSLTTIGTPAYAGTNARTWEPSLSLYNGESETMRVIRSLIRRGTQGERVRMVCAGPSTVAGTGGAEPMVAVSSWPSQLAALLGARHGRVAASRYDNRWSFTGGMSGRSSLWALSASSDAEFTATYTSHEPATGYTLFAYSQEGAVLGVAVDGTPAGSVEVPGLSGWKAVRIEGLTDKSHTITLSGPAGVYIDSIEADSTSLTIHNSGRPGASAENWVPQDTDSSWSHLFATAFGTMLNGDVPVPDLVLTQPVLNGSTPGQIAEAVAAVAALSIPTALVTCGGVGGATSGTVPSQIAALYGAADEFDLPLIDLTDTMGWHATANPKGLMADTVHPNRRGYSVQAWRIYRALIGA